MTVTKIISTLLVISALIFSGCVFGPDGPSDNEVKEMITSSIENRLDAFCVNAEVEKLEILDRGTTQEQGGTTYYSVRTKAELKCGRGMFSGGDKTEIKEYQFWRNEYDEWRFRSSSF